MFLMKKERLYVAHAPQQQLPSDPDCRCANEQQPWKAAPPSGTAMCMRKGQSQLTRIFRAPLKADRSSWRALPGLSPVIWSRSLLLPLCFLKHKKNGFNEIISKALYGREDQDYSMISRFQGIQWHKFGLITNMINDILGILLVQ